MLIMKKTTKKTKYIPFSEVKRKILRNPEVRREYENLQPKYAVISAVLDARIKRGITQRELADRVGTTQSAIARFESGTGNPTLAFLRKVSHALGKEIKVTVK